MGTREQRRVVISFLALVLIVIGLLLLFRRLEARGREETMSVPQTAEPAPTNKPTPEPTPEPTPDPTPEPTP